MKLVPPLVFGVHAAAIDDTDTHVRRGNHLRFLVSPLLGLPRTPFIVERATSHPKPINKRTSAEFRDARGQRLHPPFVMRKGERVTATIVSGPGLTCIWAKLNGTNMSILNQGRAPTRDTGGRDGPITDPRWNEVIFNRPVRRRERAGTLRDRLGEIQGIRTNRNWDSILSGATAVLDPLQSALRVEAFAQAPAGTVSVGSKTGEDWTFSAPSILFLVITGSGRVGGVDWIAAEDPQPNLQYKFVDVVGLPHQGGRRYYNSRLAESLSRNRVIDQSPKRQPLQDIEADALIPAPPQHDPNAEVQRVEALSEGIERDLDKLINDPQDPFLQRVSEPLEDPAKPGQTFGNLGMSRLHRILQGQMDPGVASKLGFLWRDGDRDLEPGELSFYRVSAVFKRPVLADDASDLARLVDSHLETTPEPARLRSPAVLREGLDVIFKGAGVAPSDPSVGRSFLDAEADAIVRAVAVVTNDAMLDKLANCSILSVTDRGWQFSQPLQPRREIDMALGGVVTGACLALRRRNPMPGVLAERLNRPTARNTDIRLPVVLSSQFEIAREDVGLPVSGYYRDRRATPSKLDYAVAQQDLFGRWSGWVVGRAPEGKRPNPPVPVLSASYRPADPKDADRKGGRVRVQVHVPDAETLPPAGRPLSNLHLACTDPLGSAVGAAGSNTLRERAFVEPVSAKTPLTQPDGTDSDQFAIVFRFEGPVLEPGEQRVVTLTARWEDTHGQKSAPSQPVRVKLTDIRPPEQLSLPPGLRYSARPDVTGLAWIEHSWTASPGQAGFGVYYSDETRLADHLEQSGGQIETGLLADIRNERDPAVRAQLFKDNAGLFPDHLFERLEGVLVHGPQAGRHAFRHAVSGSLRILSAYKIAVESSVGSKPPLTDLPMMVVAVPNAAAPPQPTVDLSMDSGSGVPVVRVRIKAPSGVTTPSRWRLRRSRLSGKNPIGMPIVAEGTFGPETDGDRLFVAEYLDTGPVRDAPNAVLDPWLRYSYVAEVQGPPAAGSGSVIPGTSERIPVIEGLWSTPSPSMDVLVIPASAPSAPALSDFDTSPDGMAQLRVDVAEPLTGAEVGSYRIRVVRRDPDGGGVEVMPSVSVSGPGPFAVEVASTAAGTIPRGTVFTVGIIDPLERLSPLSSFTVS
ncbi:MAG: hypothetical protein WBF53_16595 [Litorimonas sp.]